MQLNRLKKKKLKLFLLQVIDGGWLLKNTDYNINFPITNYGIVEDCHICLMHYLSQYLRNLKIKVTNFNKINF